jgi:hypothetical protein
LNITKSTPENFVNGLRKPVKISGNILAAADSISEANAHLEAALEKLGGALPSSYLQRESDDNHTS